MPCWYFDKGDLKKTPSITDGVPPETEARYRREGPRFIFDMGTRLGLHHDTIATGIVFFHRFYVFHSFKKFPRYITATCCLFLAGKVEETPKKCKDLVKVARSLLTDPQFVQFGEDPREEVMTFERILLQTIKFDLMVEHPYKYMVQYARALKGDRSKIEKLVQMAWTFINDSLCTSLCLQWEPQIVAVAVMYLAGRLCKFEPQDWAYNRGRWWEQFIDDISMDLLEDICHQVLDLYSHQKGKSTSSSKSKRERPKTPGDPDRSLEPQAKLSRQDLKHSKPSNVKAKEKPSTPSSQSKNISSSGQVASKKPSNAQQALSTSQPQVSRQDSTNTEVVAMDTVETGDHGSIETHLSASQQSPVASSMKKSSDPNSYYSNMNPYQTYVAGGEMSQTRQFTQSYTAPPSLYQTQPPSNYGAIPTPQTPPVPPRPGFSAHPTQAFPPGYSQPGYESVHPGFQPTRFAPTAPPNYRQPPPVFPPAAQHFSGNRGQATSTGLATVRITGRRDQQKGNPWTG